MPADCDDLPPALAFFHFDAAVNHGVTGAIRLLQQAVGTDVDGEMGPLTLSAVARAPVAVTLQAYAEARRARYRALPHFWRFGRGWLQRVDTTLSRALTIAAERPSAPARPVPLSLPPQKGPSAMTDTTTATPAPQSKWWGQSVTIWGALITALSTVLPALGPALGIEITTDLVRELGGEVVQTIQAVGGLIGTILTIYGRARHAAARATPDDRKILSAQLRQTHSRRVQAPLAREARCCRLRLPSRESLPLPLHSCLPAPPLPPLLRAPGPATRIGRMRPQS
jgi:lysozyme family protein